MAVGTARMEALGVSRAGPRLARRKDKRQSARRPAGHLC
jgi:hypothetical protein